MELIKINTDHYIIVDDSEIKEGDYTLYSGDIFTVKESNKDFIWLNNQNMTCEIGVNTSQYKLIQKITHSTQLLELLSENGLSGMGFSKVKPLNIFNVKELIGEVDVEKKAEEWFLINQYNQQDMIHSHRIPEYITTKNLWVTSYNQALEDNKDKKYTEEDLRKAIEFGYQLRCNHKPINSGYNWVKDFIIQSLQPKTEWEVEIIDGQLKLK